MLKLQQIAEEGENITISDTQVTQTGTQSEPPQVLLAEAESSSSSTDFTWLKGTTPPTFKCIPLNPEEKNNQDKKRRGGSII